MHMAKKPQNKTKTQPVLHKMYWRIKGYSGFQCYKILLSFFFQAHIVFFVCSHEPESEAHKTKQNKNKNTYSVRR